MARVLVTGAAGFLGANLVRDLLARGHEVVGFDNLSFGRQRNLEECLSHPRFRFVRADIRDPRAVARAAAGAQVAVHLAAHKIPRYGDAYDTLVVNAEGTRNVLEAARAAGARVIAASTSDVYGRSDRLPFREDGPLVLGGPQVRRWAYAASKIYGEQLLFAYHERFGLDFLVLRLFGAYGPHQSLTWRGGPQAVFIRCALAGRPLPVHGDGSQTRCLTYVDDMTAALVRCVEDGSIKNEVMNLGSDRPVTILDLARLSWRLVRGDEDEPAIRFVPYASFGNYEDVEHRMPDLARARARLGFEPRVGLEEGLRRTIAWQRIVTPRPAPGRAAARRHRVAFVAPMLDEARNLPALLGEMAAAADLIGVDYEAILVDDGSTDETPAVVERLSGRYPVTRLVHGRTLGVGRAFTTGFEHLIDRIGDEDLVVTLEADLTSDLSILPDMVACLNEGADLVLASCYLTAGGIVQTSGARILVSRVANWMARRVLGLGDVRTLSSFYRVMRGRTLRALAARSGRPLLERRGFECMLELLVKARAAGLEIAEVPMVLDTSRRLGASRMPVARTAAGYLGLFARHLAGRLAPSVAWKRRARSPDLSYAPASSNPAGSSRPSR